MHSYNKAMILMNYFILILFILLYIVFKNHLFKRQLIWMKKKSEIKILITSDSLDVGFANKIFNILESMLISIQTGRCLQSIVTYFYS